jgi:hypothetical protein
MLWNKVYHFNRLRRVRGEHLGCIIWESYRADIAAIISFVTQGCFDAPHMQEGRVPLFKRRMILTVFLNLLYVSM